MKSRFTTAKILTEDFIRRLHTKMYGNVWKWAGEFRKTNKNIGVDKYTIGIKLQQLLGDCSYRLENTLYDPDEIAIRFKHRIVNIHCFPNGNGRHSRLVADVIAAHVFKRPVFTWSGTNLVQQGDPRQKYREAI